MCQPDCQVRMHRLPTLPLELSPSWVQAPEGHHCQGPLLSGAGQGPGFRGGALTPVPPGPRHRMPREQWWLNLRLMLKMLAHYRISMADYVSGELEHVTRRTLSIDKGF